jgi:hypothetical protein
MQVCYYNFRTSNSALLVAVLLMQALTAPAALGCVLRSAAHQLTSALLNVGEPYDRQSWISREVMLSEGTSQQHQQQEAHPSLQHLLSPQQSAQSDLIGTSWSQDGREFGTASYLLSSRPCVEGRPNTPVSPGSRSMHELCGASPQGQSQQRHWQNNSSMQQQQRQEPQPLRSDAEHAAAEGVRTAGSTAAAGQGPDRPPSRPYSRSSSPVQRRLAEAMALEAKAAAAAVLRSPAASSNASLATGAGRGRRVPAAAAGEQHGRQRAGERMHSPTRSPRLAGERCRMQAWH